MLNEIESYIFGLLITDGSLYLTSRNRGKVSLEVSYIDLDIVEKLCKFISGSKIYTRERITNFSGKKVHRTAIFINFKLEFRTKLISYGFPIKNKTMNASIPIVEFNEFDFWRGVIDGDGSLGITSKNIPFISLVTKSENLKIEYLKFLEKYLNIKKSINRNKRDNVYNIMVTNENAIKLINLIYYDTSKIYLNRKFIKAKQVLLWQRNN
jgi:hypothetical protein